MNFRIVSFVFIFLYTGFNLRAQSLEWIFNTNSNPNDSITDFSTDANGNSYVTGTFNGLVDFDPGPGSTTLFAIGIETFIAKYDNAGNLIWAKHISNNSNSLKVNRSSIVLNSVGEILVTGSFSEDTDFDPGAGSYILSAMMDYDQYILKLDNNGNFIWATSYSNYYGLGYEFASSIEIDENDDIYISGLWKEFSSMVPDINYLIKFSKNGNFIREKSFSQNLFPVNGNGIGSFQNSIILFGSFTGTIDINPNGPVQNLNSAGNYDGVYIELDTAGNFIGGGKIGGSSFDKVLDLTYDNLNNLYLTGSFYGTADLDPGAGISNYISNGNSDIYFIKLDGTRNLVFNKQIGGTTEDFCNSIAYLSGNLFLTGSFGGTVDFDAGVSVKNIVSQNGADAYLLSYDDQGGFIDVKTFDGLSFSNPLHLNTDPNENIYISGFVNGNGDFDPSVSVNNITTNGFYDGFLMKFKPCTNTFATLNVDYCGSYTINSQTFYLSDTYTQVLVNSNGCDSILTLNLNLNQVIQEICVVTVDTVLADHNIVVWEKPGVIDFIDSFLIYRETATGSGVFNYLDAVHRDSLSEYPDLAANPNISEYTYHIKILDTCGTILDSGLYHRSIFLDYTGLGNFTWTDYEIENQSNVVLRYNFWRDSLASGDWRLLDTIAATGTNSYTDNDYAIYPNALYRVDLVFSSGNSCSPSRVGVNTSRSNIKNAGLSGNTISEEILSNISVYPNPANEILNINYRNIAGKTEIQIFDAVGKLVFSSDEKLNTIDISGFADGVYTLQVKTEIGIKNLKVVKE